MVFDEQPSLSLVSIAYVSYCGQRSLKLHTSDLPLRRQKRKKKYPVPKDYSGWSAQKNCSVDQNSAEVTCKGF